MVRVHGASWTVGVSQSSQYKQSTESFPHDVTDDTTERYGVRSSDSLQICRFFYFCSVEAIPSSVFNAIDLRRRYRLKAIPQDTLVPYKNVPTETAIPSSSLDETFQRRFFVVDSPYCVLFDNDSVIVVVTNDHKTESSVTPSNRDSLRWQQRVWHLP